MEAAADAAGAPRVAAPGERGALPDFPPGRAGAKAGSGGCGGARQEPSTSLCGEASGVVRAQAYSEEATEAVWMIFVGPSGAKGWWVKRAQGWGSRVPVCPWERTLGPTAYLGTATRPARGHSCPQP